MNHYHLRKMKPKIDVITLGCRVNQAESESIATAFRENGDRNCTSSGPFQQVCIINTCAVTGKAAMQSRQAIRKAIRNHPNALIIATGCYAQSDPEAIGKIDGVDCIVGHCDKHRMIQIIEQADKKSITGPIIFHRDIARQHRFAPMPGPAVGARTRPFLKIQDGCDDFCTYCIVPHTRGRSRSLPPDRVLSELEQLRAFGAMEVVLTGIHLGRYGHDLTPPVSLLDLLERIEGTDAIERIRLSSIEPTELDDRLLRFISNHIRICRHLHIPLQSGDDEILNRMHRPYTPEMYAAVVETAHRLLPDAAIGADVMVGFPGETDEAFENTFELIRALPISYLHIFPFSPRPPAPASRLPNPVPSSVVKNRCAALTRLGKDKKAAFYNRLAGKELDVILEGRQEEQTGKLKGISDNYIPVFINGPDSLINRRVKCRAVTGKGHHGIIGELIPMDPDTSAYAG